MRVPPLAAAGFNANAAPAGSRDDQTDLSGLITTLRRGLGRILLYTLAAVALALLYLLLATPRYAATTSIFVGPRYRKIATEDVVQGSSAADLSLIESQLAIIASDATLRRVVEKERLTEDPEFVPPAGGGLLSSIREALLGKRERSEPTLEAMISLAKALKVKRAQRSYVIDVEVLSRNSVKAARLADAVAAAYLADQTEAKASEARRANRLLDGRLDQLRDQVRRAEMRVDEFKRSSGILTSEGGLVNEQLLTRLNGELASARAAVAETKGRLDEVAAAAKTGGDVASLPEAVRSPLVQRLREQMTAVARREASLAGQLGPRHPVLIEARSQVAEVRQQITAELRRISAAVQSEHQAAVNREREITRNLDRSKIDASKTQTSLIRLRELERELEASRDILKTFLARAKETYEQQNMATPDARVITPAAIPSSPSRPIAWLVLGLGLFGGLGVGVVRALMRDHLDQSLRSASQIAATTGLRTLATIPTLSRRSSLTRAARRLRGAAHCEPAALGDLMSAITDPTTTSDGPYRQAILRLLTRIRALSRPGHPNVIMVLSSHSGSGTTGTTLALAYAAAMGGEKTLLIDACSSNPELSRVFALDVRQDRSCVLDSKEHLAEITTRDARSGLSLLPIALADLRRLKTGQRQRLVAGLGKVAPDYDLVLIDGGALLEDEAILSLVPAAEHLLLVARAGTTERETISEALQTLDAHRDRTAGLILTFAERSSP